MSRFKPILITLVGTAALLSASPLWADSEATTNVPAASQPAPAPATAAPSDDKARADRVDYDQMRQRRSADRKAFMEARLAALRAGLELTPAQTPLWSPVEDALRDVRKARHAMHTRGDDASDPAARLKQRSERLVAIGQATGKLADAAGPFLKSLTAEQKDRLPILMERIGSPHLLRRLFAAEDDRGGMRHGDRDERHGPRFADRDGGDRGYGFGGHEMDRWSEHDRGGFDRECRMGGDRQGYGFDRDGGFDRQRHDHGGDDDRG